MTEDSPYRHGVQGTPRARNVRNPHNGTPTASVTSISPNPVNYGSTATFTGSGSDPDGTITAYSWRSSIDGVLSSSATFTTDDLTAGNHTIYFKVRDNNSQWSTEASSWPGPSSDARQGVRQPVHR